LPGISLEKGLKTVVGNEKLYRNLLGKFFESNRNVVPEIKNTLEAGDMETAAREIPIDIGMVTPLLTEMAELLESDLGEAMGLLESLKPHLENSSVRGEFRRFEKSLESFDTDDAVRSLQKVAEALDISLKEDG